MKAVYVLFTLVVVALAADPVPPKLWPPTWYTWVVTSVVKIGVDKPLYDFGQLVAYNALEQWTCRHGQQNLLYPVTNRPVDACYYTTGDHFMLNDNTANSTCSGSAKITGTLGQLAYPPEYLAVAKFLGVDKVAQKDCNHFVAMGIVIDNENVQMDVWTTVDTQLPCQISVTDLVGRVVTNWAFDGFASFIPVTGANQCGSPKIMCAEENYLCRVKPNADPTQLGAALSWVCDPTHLDCSPIAPGGPNYIPNTLVDHSNWAFNAYFRLHRAAQGVGACDFSGLGQLVPPTNITTPKVEIKPLSVASLTDVFSNNLVCERS